MIGLGVGAIGCLFAVIGVFEQAIVEIPSAIKTKNFNFFDVPGFSGRHTATCQPPNANFITRPNPQ
jgi:hypothetical protein